MGHIHTKSMTCFRMAEGGISVELQVFKVQMVVDVDDNGDVGCGDDDSGDGR